MQIKRGATRTVFLIGRWAIKVPTARRWRQFLRGLLGNMDEAEFYSRGATGLCPVLFHIPGGLLVVMRRAEPLTDAEWQPIEWHEPDAYSGGVKVDLEHKRSSWGMVDGELVAVDYGKVG